MNKKLTLNDYEYFLEEINKEIVQMNNKLIEIEKERENLEVILALSEVLFEKQLPKYLEKLYNDTLVFGDEIASNFVDSFERTLEYYRKVFIEKED
ncbi:MAG: hypothetical protein ACTSR3_00980 [Candidatus Helarchaeota archaeon]